ncbi:hypothetical protein [Kordia jejudonensis]|uniref:hypothetical protein n=1 Tax=Kordia jejudonensis TaxID=1348245 RepID=UPI0006291AB3|nr:hypothetical protein [Kordia jejudonensis]
MIAKKYFSALVILITLLGFYTKQTPVPNQEIVLQFVDQAVVVEDSQNIIDAIKSQLQSVGVTDIQVTEQENGILKIAYYSDAEVADIKKILAANGIHSEKDSQELPNNKKVVAFQNDGNVETFKLDVYEIQTSLNPYAGVHGKYILALQKEYDKSPNPNSFGNTHTFFTGEFKNTIALAYTESTYTTILKENISYEIPDVRAGPTSSLHS